MSMSEQDAAKIIEAARRRVRQEVLNALMRRDWNAFRAHCCKRIEFVEFVSGASMTGHSPIDDQHKKEERYLTYTLAYDTQSIPSKEVKDRFDALCGAVDSALKFSGYRRWLFEETARNETEVPCGFSLRAKFVSSEKWLVYLDFEQGQWRVRRLIDKWH